MVSLKKINWPLVGEVLKVALALNVFFFSFCGASALFNLLGIKDFILTIIGFNLTCFCVLILACIGVAALKMMRDFWSL